MVKYTNLISQYEMSPPLFSNVDFWWRSWSNNQRLKKLNTAIGACRPEIGLIWSKVGGLSDLKKYQILFVAFISRFFQFIQIILHFNKYQPMIKLMTIQNSTFSSRLQSQEYPYYPSSRLPHPYYSWLDPFDSFDHATLGHPAQYGSQLLQILVEEHVIHYVGWREHFIGEG